MAGVAGDTGVVAVPKVKVPGPQGAAAGRETWRPGVAGVPALNECSIQPFLPQLIFCTKTDSEGIHCY